MIGRAGSKGYPGKNIINLNGRKLCEYPLIATNIQSFVNFLLSDVIDLIGISFAFLGRIISGLFKSERCIS